MKGEYSEGSQLHHEIGETVSRTPSPKGNRDDEDNADGPELRARLPLQLADLSLLRLESDLFAHG